LSWDGNSASLIAIAKETAAKFKTWPLKKRASYLAAAEPVTCKIICVPLSNFTLRLAELITEP
jgi:hypothetical protein